MAEPILEVRDVTKMFGSIIALSEVSCRVYPGEVTCLLGDCHRITVSLSGKPHKRMPELMPGEIHRFTIFICNTLICIPSLWIKNCIASCVNKFPPGTKAFDCCCRSTT